MTKFKIMMKFCDFVVSKITPNDCGRLRKPKV